MPRPKKCRRIGCDPGHKYFKPRGVPLSQLKTVDLGADELESLRLADLLRISQADAADSMDVSQPTFNRILAEARAKVATSIVEGCALRIGDAPGEHVAIEPCGRNHGRACEKHRSGAGRRFSQSSHDETTKDVKQ